MHKAGEKTKMFELLKTKIELLKTKKAIRKIAFLKVHFLFHNHHSCLPW